MWLCKIKLKHNCTIGNRMLKFNLMVYLTYLKNYKEKNQCFSVGMYKLLGDQKDIKNFFNDFKKDKNIIDAELNKNIMIATEKSSKLIISNFTEKLFFQKPVFIDQNGFEYWEFFSFYRDLINKFLIKIQKKCEFFELQKLVKSKLDDIYFPHAISKLTDKQKRAFDLAMLNGYYLIPKKITIRELAKLMNITKSTYQNHLKRAESKILPDMASMHLFE